MLHGLMRGAVLAETDGVVSHDENHRQTHQRRETNRRTRVIREDQKSAAVNTETAVQRDAVHRRDHRMFAHAEENILSRVAGLGRDLLLAFGASRVGAGQVGGAAEQFGHGAGEGGDRLSRRLARGDGSPVFGEFARKPFKRRPSLRQKTILQTAAELVAARMVLKSPRPVFVFVMRAGGGVAPELPDVFGNLKRRMIPVQRLPQGGDLVRAERRAVTRGGAGFFIRAEGDGRAARHKRRTRVVQGLFQGGGDGGGVVSVGGDGVPAERGESRGDILAEGEVGGAVNRDAVVVPQDGEAAETQPSGERGGFVSDAFHQAAVAGEGVGPVADKISAELGGEDALGEGDADGVGESLSEGAGGGFNAGGVRVFGMSGRERAETAEVSEFRDRHLRILAEVEKRVEQHGAVSGREDEAVAVGPVGVARVVFQKAREEDGGDIGHAEGHAGVSAGGVFNGVGGEDADGGGHPPELRGRGRRGHGFIVPCGGGGVKGGV